MTCRNNKIFLTREESISSSIEQSHFFIDPRIVPIIVPVFCACMIAALANHSHALQGLVSGCNSRSDIDNQTEKIIAVKQFVSLNKINQIY